MRLRYKRYNVSHGVRNIKTKLAVVLSVVGLAIGGGMGVSLMGMASASAAPNMSYTDTAFTDLNLVTDRQAPSGGSTITPNQLTLKIDNNAANTSAMFYQTEGLNGTIPVSQSIRSDLFVDPAWTGKQVRAGLWGVASSDTASDVAWPIIEYTTVGDGGFTGWRVYDTMNDGWTNLTGVSAKTGRWYQLEITFNSTTKNYDYYVNGSFVKSLPAFYGTDVYGKLTGVIFNNKNFATNNANDNYTVKWRDFEIGVTRPSKSDCKDDGWRHMRDHHYKNQGECVSWEQHHGDNHWYDRGHSFREPRDDRN